jgi:dihydrofolate reductase
VALQRAGPIAGYAIVSEDGMLATAARVMPTSLKIDADQQFFEQSLDQTDVIVHGRNSHEQQPRSPLRYRLRLTRTVASLAAHPTNPKARLWNPAGASFEKALAEFGLASPSIAIIGGPDVFALFLDRYDSFHLSRASDVWLPGGRPVFPDVPGRTPEEVLSAHGLIPGSRRLLDPAEGVTLVSWQRARESDGSN